MKGTTFYNYWYYSNRQTFNSKVLTYEIAKARIRFLDLPRADMVRFGLAIGQRKANIIGLKWSWLGKDLTRMVIPDDVTKNGEGYIIMLNKQTIEVLEKRRLDRKRLAKKYPHLSLDYVFVQEGSRHLGKPMTGGAMTRVIWKRSILLYNESVRLRA